MNSQTDTLFLVLQFKNKICSKMGIEFQSFFEEIMQESCPNFEKVPSAGGDGGNDGWIRKLGRYYQVYAPQEPSIKDGVVAEKFKKDFQKLQNHWNSIKEIKEYYFVFNDKYEGRGKHSSYQSKFTGRYRCVAFVLARTDSYRTTTRRTIQTRSYYRRRKKTLGALYRTRIYKV